MVGRWARSTAACFAALHVQCPVQQAARAGPAQSFDEQQARPFPQHTFTHTCTCTHIGAETDLLGAGAAFRRLIEEDRVPSVIFWGPPGCGKTTICEIISRYNDFDIIVSVSPRSLRPLPPCSRCIALLCALIIGRRVDQIWDPRHSRRKSVKLSAVTSGVGDIRKAVEDATGIKRLLNKVSAGLTHVSPPFF